MSHAEKTTAKIDKALLFMQLLLVAGVMIFFNFSSSAQAETAPTITGKPLMVPSKSATTSTFAVPAQSNPRDQSKKLDPAS